MTVHELHSVITYKLRNPVIANKLRNPVLSLPQAFSSHLSAGLPFQRALCPTDPPSIPGSFQDKFCF